MAENVLEKNVSYKIVCPNCGREYIPSEIFIPKYFFGDPGVIERDDSGKILWITGNNINSSESFICDNCSCEFKIQAKISFSVNKVTDNLDTEEVSVPRKLKNARLFMLDEE